jgi:hypothetical protein
LERGKRRKGMQLGTCNRVVELSLERRKEQEHASHFGKREGGKSMQLILGRVKSNPFSLLVFIALKVCWVFGC